MLNIDNNSWYQIAIADTDNTQVFIGTQLYEDNGTSGAAFITGSGAALNRNGKSIFTMPIRSYTSCEQSLQGLKGIWSSEWIQMRTHWTKPFS